MVNKYVDIQFVSFVISTIQAACFGSVDHNG